MNVLIKTHCLLCDAEADVPYSEATDYVCADCKDFYDHLYEQQSDYRDHCITFEPTYNKEDGSM